MFLIEEFELKTVEAVTCLIKANHYIQALVILYSAIDTLSYASLPDGNITKTGFCSWVASYMRPEKWLACTPEDLYAARCGLVHSGCVESSMSRKGEATPIWYVTATSSALNFQTTLAQRGVHAKVVSITALVSAFTFGADNFIEDIKCDQVRQSHVTARIQDWLAFVPINSVVSH